MSRTDFLTSTQYHKFTQRSRFSILRVTDYKGVGRTPDAIDLLTSIVD
jgi:hypothetical protein